MSPIVALVLIAVVIAILVWMFSDRFKGFSKGSPSKAKKASAEKSGNPSSIALNVRELAAAINAWSN